MGIWRKAYLFSEKTRNLESRQCWLKCQHCLSTWGETGTTYISMLVGVFDGRQDTRWLCDTCQSLYDDAGKLLTNKTQSND